MGFNPHTDPMDRKTILDPLDSMPKTVQRCVNCSQVFYDTDSGQHTCNTNSLKPKASLGFYNKIEDFLNYDFYSKIKELWTGNGCKRHKKLEPEEKAEKSNPKEEIKTNDFSFSPYDNFF